MAKTKKKSSAPSGLQIKRQGNKFTATWGIPSSKYGDGQHFEYKLKTTTSGKWESKSVGKNTTSKTFSIDKSDYYPNNKSNSTSKKPKLTAVFARVQGNRDEDTKHTYSWSDWTDKKFDIDPPAKPSCSFALDNVTYYKGAFSWDVDVSDTGQRIFTRVLWESILLENCNTDDSKEVASLFKNSTTGWQTGTSTSASNSKAIEEDSDLFNKTTYSYTRWFRIMAQGPNGDSEWQYSRHVYATPEAAKNVKTDCKITGATEYTITGQWESPASVAHPIEKTEMQYAKQIPINANLDCPTTGVDWTAGVVVNDSSDKDGGSFTLTDLLDVDQCLYVKVQNFWDHNEKASDIVLTQVGYLKDPTSLSVIPNATTHAITVSATNTSEATPSKLAVEFTMVKVLTNGQVRKHTQIVGVLEDNNSHVIQCPDWTGASQVSIKVYAFIGTTSYTTESSIRTYTIVEKMRSANSLYFNITGEIPAIPTGVTLDKTDIEGTLKVGWKWADNVSGVELSWANHEDAWESTDPPETYEVSSAKLPAWNISGLELGQRWYVKLRFYTGSGEAVVYGDYTLAYFKDLLAVPDMPALKLSPGVVPIDGLITASWVYLSTDKTSQGYAELALVTNGVVGSPFIHTLTDQQVTFKPTDFQGQTGNTYNIAVRVKSDQGEFSDWSNTQPIIVADPLSCEISLNFDEGSCWAMEDIVDDADQPLVTRSVCSLKKTPVVISVTGSSTAVQTTIIIERADDFSQPQPDGTVAAGVKGETICVKHSYNSDPIEIITEDLVGTLDDNAVYNILATIQDNLGREAEATPVRFEVHWAHQVDFPTAKIEVDQNNMIVKITPRPFAGVAETDYCDIYRLSVDKPELIYHKAAFNTTYVDPYPTLGEFGGYRIVACTVDGDFTTASKVIAWYDSQEYDWPTVNNPDDLSIIDFEAGQIRFYYHNDLSGGWTKNFTKVQYLDGKTVGYWTPGFSHDKTLKTLVITTLDQEMIQLIHQLATYAGPCHIRTSEGVSFTANVEVSNEDNTHEDLGMRLSYSLGIEQIESEGFDAVTLAQWNRTQ